MSEAWRNEQDRQSDDSALHECLCGLSPGRVLCKVLVHGRGLVTWIEGGMQNRLTVCVLESEGYVCLSALRVGL